MTASVTEYKTAGDYLADADVEFAAGNHDAGLTLLMQSAHRALAQLAKASGEPAATPADLYTFAARLDEQYDADGWHARNLHTADIIGDPEQYHALPAYRQRFHSKFAVRELIAALLAYQQGDLTTPDDFLTASDREFAAGNHGAGSNLLAQSVHCALAQLAKAAGKPSETSAELRDFADWLDRKHGTEGWHAGRLQVANGFDDNARHQYMHEEDLDFDRPTVRKFVATLLSYQRKNDST